VPDGFDRTTVLQSQRRDDCRVLGVGLGGRPDLCAVDEYFRDPTVVEPADPPV
jgi:hypothetical protein